MSNSPNQDQLGEATMIKFKFRDVATALVKERGIHEGYWSIYVRFGIKAVNIGFDGSDPMPTALIPILDMGLTKTEQGPLAVDAAIVNPAPKKSVTKKKSAGTKKRSTISKKSR